jgi:hypothetical protein
VEPDCSLGPEALKGDLDSSTQRDKAGAISHNALSGSILTSVMRMPDSLTIRLHHPWCRVTNPHLCRRARGQSLEWRDALRQDREVRTILG